MSKISQKSEKCASTFYSHCTFDSGTFVLVNAVGQHDVPECRRLWLFIENLACYYFLISLHDIKTVIL